MIRINLLPFRAARKKENIKRQISVYILTLLFLVVLMVFFFLQLNGKVRTLRSEKAQIKKQLATYATTTQKIKKIKKQIKEIRAKLNIIRDLEKKKTGPVFLLDEIAMAVPKNRLWLRSLSEKKGLLKLQGTAMDNETIALFMTNLEKADHITTVDLQSATLRRLDKYKLNVVDFRLDCKTYSFKEKKRKIKHGRRKRKR
ncbi:MAG: PilN domain-containing protein [Deltaproteobacteria bacterium]|nr:PilN domain-containing protein [Deltaproteobacteria bacterium]